MDRIHGDEAQASCIAKILSASQKYMRGQNVSLDKKIVIIYILYTSRCDCMLLIVQPLKLGKVVLIFALFYELYFPLRKI